jgi:putative CocE/NonD family hydrolase
MTGIVIDDSLEMAAPDGAVLRATVQRPPGRNPAILVRTPYDRSFGPSFDASVAPDRANARGYAVVVQDVRGRYGSDGGMTGLTDEGADGAAAVRWVAGQPWCDGRVVMAGRSYNGITQLAAAGAQPEGLAAIAPVVCGCDQWGGSVYLGGAFQLGFNLFWMTLLSSRRARRGLPEAYTHLPLGSAPVLPDAELRDRYLWWLAHDVHGPEWERRSLRVNHPTIAAPALIVTGWWDPFVDGALDNFGGIRTYGGPVARAGTRLIVGPWGHGTAYGRWPDAQLIADGPTDFDIDGEQLDFFDQHVHGRVPRVGSPVVRLFLTGVNRWLDAEEWPPPGAVERRLYLSDRGGLADAPPEHAHVDHHPYDPSDPTPTLGGQTLLPGPLLKPICGPLDQRPAEERTDVLTYSSAPLARPLTVVGRVLAEMHVATTSTDMDVVVRLCDAEPDGPVHLLCEGVARARFHLGHDAPVGLTPGQPVALTVNVGAVGHRFAAGHRIRVLVTGSSFPRFDRNPGAPIPVGEVQPTDLRPARHSIFSGGSRASHLRLLVFEDGDANP